MQNKINEIFKDLNLSNEEKTYITNQYMEIEKNFQDGKFNFNKLNLSSTKEYIEILHKYLEINGYGFLCNEINKNISKIELAKLLIDSKLINKPEINIESNLESEISYERIFGCSKEFKIKFKVSDVPFEILSIDYNEKEYLHCSINNSRDTIKVEINIGENKDITDRETIIVYTSLGVKEFTFTINMNKEVDDEIILKDFNDFKNICSEDIKKAFEIFSGQDFKKWLIKKNYIAQIINYDEAEKLSQESSNGFSSKFNTFCMLNEIYLEDFDENSILKEIAKEEIASKETDKKEMIGKDIIAEEENDSNIVNKNVINSNLEDNIIEKINAEDKAHNSIDALNEVKVEKVVFDKHIENKIDILNYDDTKENKYTTYNKNQKYNEKIYNEKTNNEVNKKTEDNSEKNILSKFKSFFKKK